MGQNVVQLSRVGMQIVEMRILRYEWDSITYPVLFYVTFLK